MRPTRVACSRSTVSFHLFRRFSTPVRIHCTGNGEILVENHASEPELWFQMAHIFYLKEERDIAIELIKMQTEFLRRGKNAEGDEADTILWWRLGNMLTTKCQYNDAVAVYKAAIELNPGELYLRKCLADVYMEKGNHSKAIRVYKAAIKQQPANFWMWHNICKVYLATNDLDGAITTCEAGRTSANPSPAIMLSHLYAVKGNYASAINSLDKSDREILMNLLWRLKEFIDDLTPPECRETKMVENIFKRYSTLLIAILMEKVSADAIRKYRLVESLVKCNHFFCIGIRRYGNDITLCCLDWKC